MDSFPEPDEIKKLMVDSFQHLSNAGKIEVFAFYLFKRYPV